jgi:23S rRNA (cytosine1962-C5)-methyltransferase
MNRGVFPHVAFADYALLDSGGGEKLERFADVVVRRPDPQALWPRGTPETAWRAADLTFVPDASSGGRGGKWTARKGADGMRAARDEWTVRCGEATLLARPTPFKHVGIFPEQSANWELVRAARGKLASSAPDAMSPRLLNLFGYTGAASIVALRAEYDVTHVDASRTSLAWARANLVASGLAEDAMRIVLDDALAFAQREARRGSKYHVILLDPPHYGRGPKGEKWQFEDAIAELVAAVRDLAAERALVVLSTYAIGTSPLSLENLLADLGEGVLESGELALPEGSPRARLLPAGFCARWSRGLHENGSRGL